MGRNRKVIHDARCRKLGKRKKRKRTGHKFTDEIQELRQIDYSKCIRKAPEVFSFLKNLDETVEYFADTILELKRGGYKKSFILDSSDVTLVTTDVIMYLIALMRNVRANRINQYTFIGSYPKNIDAKRIYQESGLLKFVKSNFKRLPQNTEKMQIISGNNNSGIEAKRMCEFVMKKLSVDMVYTNDLYGLLIEMMSNVYYHAYTNDELMNPVWYMYAEYTDRGVRFVFVDTGMGIAKTVKKKSLYEKVVNRIGRNNDSKLMKSAFDGEFRTATGKVNRGRGLPSFKEFAQSNKCQDFRVISGTGLCNMRDNKKDFETIELKNRLYGTIYIFTFVGNGGIR